MKDRKKVRDRQIGKRQKEKEIDTQRKGETDRDIKRSLEKEREKR